jgi:hypothetical protein
MPYGYMVEIEQFCVESEYATERFGDWHESYSNSFRKIYKNQNPKERSPDIVSEHDFAQGEEVYVVWVEYSSGDSFGWANYKGAEAVGILKDYESAKELSDWIYNNGPSSSNDKYKDAFTTSRGETLEVYVGAWTGYFERLETVNIEHTVISVP